MAKVTDKSAEIAIIEGILVSLKDQVKKIEMKLAALKGGSAKKVPVAVPSPAVKKAAAPVAPKKAAVVSKKKVAPKKAAPVSADKVTYQGIQYGGQEFKSKSALARYLLKTTDMTQAGIAEICGCTAACVCQIANEAK